MERHAYALWRHGKMKHINKHIWTFHCKLQWNFFFFLQYWFQYENACIITSSHLQCYFHDRYQWHHFFSVEFWFLIWFTQCFCKFTQLIFSNILSPVVFFRLALFYFLCNPLNRYFALETMWVGLINLCQKIIYVIILLWGWISLTKNSIVVD